MCVCVFLQIKKFDTNSKKNHWEIIFLIELCNSLIISFDDYFFVLFFLFYSIRSNKGKEVGL